MSQKCSITESNANKTNGRRLSLNNCQAEKSKTKSISGSRSLKNNKSDTGSAGGTGTGTGPAPAKNGQSVLNDKANRSSSNKGYKKPLVLSSQRYNKIVGNAFSEVQAQKEIEEQQKFKEYLKRGNEQVVANFKSNIQRTRDQKHQEMREQTEKRNQEGKLIFFDTLNLINMISIIDIKR